MDNSIVVDSDSEKHLCESRKFGKIYPEEERKINFDISFHQQVMLNGPEPDFSIKILKTSSVS